MWLSPEIMGGPLPESGPFVSRRQPALQGQLQRPAPHLLLDPLHPHGGGVVRQAELGRHRFDRLARQKDPLEDLPGFLLLPPAGTLDLFQRLPQTAQHPFGLVVQAGNEVFDVVGMFQQQGVDRRLSRRLIARDAPPAFPREGDQLSLRDGLQPAAEAALLGVVVEAG